MKRMISVLAIVLILVNMMLPMAASAAGNPVPAAKQAVVRVASGIYFDNNGDLRTYDSRGYYSSGTAFGVYGDGTGAQVFATNGHVVSDDDNEPYDFVYVCIDGADIRNESTLIKCNVIYVDNDIDVAIIQAEAPVVGVGTLPLMDPEEMETGDRVYALGFPGITDEVSDSNNYTVDDITVTDGIISRYLTHDGVRCMASTAKVNHGNSGGPLINEYGHAIGINTFIYTDKSTADLRCYAIYSNYVMEALDQLGIPYDQRTADNPDGVTTTAPPETQAETVPETGETTASTDDVSVSPQVERRPMDIIVIIAGVSAVCVLVTVIVLLVIRRKTPAAGMQVRNFSGNRGQENRQSMQPDAFAAEGSMRLLRIQGSDLNGKTWQLSSSATLGRDYNCTIVFPAATKGISRRHCRIDRRGNDILITDLGSTYGTYIGGVRLPPNSPYRVGPNTEIVLGGKDIKLIIQ
ncbi:MAG: trypsin-like peptidase domain-containing protein [Oscillospiraceae bacterium]|nr:trypsin-like peptidase domain-containing protein [Oscillospiraceae bacterium]